MALHNLDHVTNPQPQLLSWFSVLSRDTLKQEAQHKLPDPGTPTCFVSVLVYRRGWLIKTVLSVPLYVIEMSPLCDCGAEHINKLNQQVSVMRKEIKNLRWVRNVTWEQYISHDILFPLIVYKETVYHNPLELLYNCLHPAFWVFPSVFTLLPQADVGQCGQS